MANLSVGNFTKPYGYADYSAGRNSRSAQPGNSPANESDSTGKVSDKDKEEEKNDYMPGRENPEECETCKHRKYQDASDEGNVSMKEATHVSPTAAGSAVRAHEGMHVSNAYNKASQQNAEVVEAYVVIHTSICPECGRTYVSGGTTHTQIKYNNESNPYQQGRMSEDAANLKGAKVDYNI